MGTAVTVSHTLVRTSSTRLNQTVESVDCHEKGNLIERPTGNLNRQVERLCIMI